MPEFSPLPLRFVSDARRRGEPSDVLARDARRKAVTRVRRGTYAASGVWAALRHDEQHLARVLAVDHAARSRPVFSHESAAAVWGIPVVGGWPAEPRVTVPPGSGRRSRHGVVRHESELSSADVDVAGGLTLTSRLRTVVDLVATRSFLTGVCALEHVLFGEGFGITKGDVAAALERRRPFRGARRVDAALTFASTLSATPIESLHRVRIDELGFPQPSQQREYRGVDGRRYQADFYWEDIDGIGETDGRIKYADPRFRDGRTPEQVLWDEKRREDELRAQCAAFARLTWDDAWHRTGLIAKLERIGLRGR